ncbi:homoserine dehydrogenase [uncultured Cohaesibacter sp.]|uniref:homoserine dehydrogenase n=1 Tax=uncultured Cohaesibacter sp. TaxID=1002546 RepID=UPI00292E81C3|nr:homoserine dehydrogenase [uncultured Cohaesibacter sp.]
MSDPLKLGLAGLGTVGISALQRLLAKENTLAVKAGRTIKVKAITARSRNKDRGVDLSQFQWFDDPVAMAKSPDIDVFVELIGGDSGPAEEAVRTALMAGKHVVTANKALLAKHGNELARLAEENNVSLNFEAAVAGGIPVIKSMRESLASNEISRVYGILNGTCNYILTKMEDEGLSFDACLSEAQRLGYAEADPTFDIEGYDTAHKLAILTSIAFGSEIEANSIFVEGITSITQTDISAADDLGFRIKLLGVAMKTDTGIEQRVHPTMVPKESAIAQISDVTNAVAIEGDAVGSITLSGPGAGGDATASAVIADIVDIARGLQIIPLGRATEALEPYERARMRAHEGGYYIRLRVTDKPGVFASIAKRMAEQAISLESIVQKKPRHKSDPKSAVSANRDMPQDLVLITYMTTEKAVRAAIEAIEKDGHIVAPPQVIRIERL